MKSLYKFFELIYYKLNSLTLKGQSEDNNAHFALFMLTLLLNFNFITLFTAIDKVKILPFCITNQYEVIALFAVTYFVTYLLFVREKKYKAVKEKYSDSDKVQKRNMNYYFGLYVVLTFLSFIVVVII
ncbi:MAG: hypothetical protein ACOYXB_12695 [Bacteroidota bacterium]